MRTNRLTCADWQHERALCDAIPRLTPFTAQIILSVMDMEKLALQSLDEQSLALQLPWIPLPLLVRSLTSALLFAMTC